jgi:hypothetical protein
LRGPLFHPQARLWFETLVFRPNRPAPDPEEAGIRRGQLAWEGRKTQRPIDEYPVAKAVYIPAIFM